MERARAIASAVAFAVMLVAFAARSVPAQRRTENVVLIVTDGLRWQDLFRGPERRLMGRTAGGVADTTALLREFWRDDPHERRQLMFPFLWGEVASRGVIIGNQDLGSVARVTNPFKFSYPGYSELFTGFADPRINSNSYPPNPNVTVFEWLAQQPRFRGKVGAVATWDVFRNIFNEGRAGIDVLDGWDEPFPGKLGDDPRRSLVNELYRTSVWVWEGNASDAPMQLATKEYIKLRMPRVLFVGYGETDEWAHLRRYDLVLKSARQVDRHIADLWTFMQGMRQYRGKTTFIITTDHGRGGTEEDWISHGEDVVGAENIWMAVIGPDTPRRGEAVGGVEVKQAQVAATIAGLLGLEEQFLAASPRSASSIRQAIR